MSCFKIILGITTVVSFSIFCGTFFGLNYKEIDVNENFILTSCLVYNKKIESRYCPKVDCGGCDQRGYLYPYCHDLNVKYSNLDPQKCVEDPSQCANRTLCNNGYYCCSECCSTCTSCSGSGSSRSCHSYSCNCFCCSSTPSRTCTIYPNICYNAVLSLNYSTPEDESISSFFIKDFETDLTKAEQFIQGFTLYDSYKCYYDPDQFYDVRFSVDYTTGYWVVTGIFAFVFLMCLIFWSHILLLKIDEYSRFNWHVWCVTLFLWFGFLIPVCLFLPLMFASGVGKIGREVLFTLIMQCLWFGGMPIHTFISNIKNATHYLNVIYGFGIGIPTGIFLPILYIHKIKELVIVLSLFYTFYAINIIIYKFNVIEKVKKLFKKEPRLPTEPPPPPYNEIYKL